jgi:hypothetical protein
MLQFTFDGIPAGKITRLKNAMVEELENIANPSPADVTEATILKYLKNCLKTKIWQFERAIAINAANSDFTDNFSDPL